MADLDENLENIKATSDAFNNLIARLEEQNKATKKSLRGQTDAASNLAKLLSNDILQAAQKIKETNAEQERIQQNISRGLNQDKKIAQSREKQEKAINKLRQAQNSAKAAGFKLDQKLIKELEEQVYHSQQNLDANEEINNAVQSQIPKFKKIIAQNELLNTLFYENLTIQDLLVAGVIGLIKGFGKVDAAQKEFRSTTGQNVKAFTDLNERLVTAAEQIQSAAELSKQLGVNAQVVFSRNTIIEVAELTNNLGIAAEEAGNLAAQAKLSGTNLHDNAENIVDLTKGFIRTNKIGINFRGVMDDVSTASSALTVSLGGSTDELAKAALNARKLGINLKQAEAIAESLLDFESSIEAELEAELLTGQNLNFEKARLAALNNDIATLTEEIAKNEGISEAFASGNRIQQEAIAKSIGMTRDDMAQMIIQQKIQEGLNAQQLSDATNISLEEAKRLTTQDQITKSVDKLSQAFAPILTQVASLLDNTTAIYTVLGLMGAVSLTRTIAQLITMGSTLAGSAAAGAGLASSLTLGLGAIAIVGGIAAIVGAMQSAKQNVKTQDGVIGPQGGLMLSGPKGSVTLDSADTVVANKNGAVAGTDLLGSGALVQEMRQMKAIMTQLLNKNVDVYLDSDKVGTSLNVRTVNIQ